MTDENLIDALYEIIGARIAEARHSARGEPSQRELADAVGMSRGSIANIEAGRQRPPIHTLYDVAATLGVAPSALLPSAAELEEYLSHAVEMTASERRLLKTLEPGAQQRLRSFFASVQAEASPKEEEDPPTGGED